MKPLCLVAGFLGSGKTTFLKQLLEKLRSKKVLFLVNEFADEAVDATLIEEAGGMARYVSGGSVFCTCKADEFRERLIEAADIPEIDGVVVEASGMAEPRAMGAILADPRLEGKYLLASLVAIVDPVSYPKVSVSLPAINGQMREADYILVNKCDLVAADAAAALSGTLRELNADAVIMETTRSRADIDPFKPVRTPARQLTGSLTGCGDRQFVSLLLTSDATVPLDLVEKAFADLGTLVTRVKGWINTPDQGRVFLDRAGYGAVSVSPAGPGPNRLVVIVPKNVSQGAINRLSRLPGCVVA